MFRVCAAAPLEMQQFHLDLTMIINYLLFALKVFSDKNFVNFYHQLPDIFK